MASAVLRSPDGRVRPIWRFLIAAVLALLCWISVGCCLRPDLNSPLAVIAFAIVVSVNVSIFFALSLTLDRTTRRWPTSDSPPTFQSRA
jgi:uncharacterized membrane-anchored protein